MRGLVRLLEPLADPAVGLFARQMPPGDQRVFEDAAVRLMFQEDLILGSRRNMQAICLDVVLFGRPWGFALADIEVPVHLWYGDADIIVPLHHGRHLAERIPGAQLRIRPARAISAALARRARSSTRSSATGPAAPTWPRRSNTASPRMSNFRDAIRLGQTGLSVSRLGIGSSSVGSEAFIEEAVEQGINYLYWGSIRRPAFGRALRNVARRKREGVVLTVQSYSRVAALLAPSVEIALRVRASSTSTSCCSDVEPAAAAALVDARCGCASRARCGT